MTQSMLAVATFGRYGTQKVSMPKSGKVGDVLQLLSKQLSLKPFSLRCFSLYVGELGSPSLILEPSDNVMGYKQLCLQRHGLDYTKERKLLMTDDVAVHLLYSEALAKYKKIPSAFEPTTDQEEQLEEYLDPNFLSERQFLETALKVNGYSTVMFEGIVVQTAIETHSCTIPIDGKVTCFCTEDSFKITSSNNNNIEWKWQMIRKWKLDHPNTAIFEVTNIKGNAHMLENIHITSKGAAYMLQIAKSFCTELVYRCNPSKRPPQSPDGFIVGRPVDKLYDFVNTTLFGSGPNFTTVGMDGK